MKKILSISLLIYSIGSIAATVAAVIDTSNKVTIPQEKLDVQKTHSSNNQSTMTHKLAKQELAKAPHALSLTPKNTALTDNNGRTSTMKTATQGISQHQVTTQNTGKKTIVNFSSPKGKPLFSLTPNTNGTYTVNDLVTHKTIFTNIPARALNQLLIKNNILAPISTIGSTAGNNNSSNSTTVTSVQAGTTTTTNHCTVVGTTPLNIRCI